MLALLLVVDLVFVVGTVYLFLQDRLVPALVMLVMGSVATGVLAVRFAQRAREGRGLSPFGAVSGATPEQVTLSPAHEAEVRDLARRSRIAAVKRVRELTNSSLRAAKEYVDRLP